MKYLISDIHGDYEVWQKAKGLLQEGDTLYILGDVIDRGPDGIKILLEIVGNKQCVMLKGNHEDMMVDALTYEDMDSLRMWYMNGGDVTHAELIRDLGYGQYTTLVRWLRGLPEMLYLEDDKVLLSHSGFHIPHTLRTEADVISYAQTLEKDEVIWDRSHIHMGGQDSEVLLIHGHTPIASISDSLDPVTPVEYQKGKVCIDVGVHTYKQGAVYCVETKTVIKL
jgi:serine/threonine protein phosphatase 1